jgi:hypothetical protein
MSFHDRMGRCFALLGSEGEQRQRWRPRVDGRGAIPAAQSFERLQFGQIRSPTQALSNETAHRRQARSFGVIEREGDVAALSVASFPEGARAVSAAEISGWTLRIRSPP